MASEVLHVSQLDLWECTTECTEAASMKLQTTLERGAESLDISELMEGSLHSS